MNNTGIELSFVQFSVAQAFTPWEKQADLMASPFMGFSDPML
jgi:hypothetical protein